MAESPLTDKDWLSTILEEYKTIRAEIIHLQQAQKTTISIGITAILLMLGWGINSLEEHNFFVALVVFDFAVPVLSYLVLFLWAGDVERMVRNGFFLSKREKKVNSLFEKLDKSSPLIWEQWIRSPKIEKKANPVVQYLYKAVLAIFIGIPIASTLIFISIAWYVSSGNNLIPITETQGSTSLPVSSLSQVSVPVNYLWLDSSVIGLALNLIVALEMLWRWYRWGRSLLNYGERFNN
jgi:hypothetical protein